jgi:hypothetical protein
VASESGKIMQDNALCHWQSLHSAVIRNFWAGFCIAQASGCFEKKSTKFVNKIGRFTWMCVTVVE